MTGVLLTLAFCALCIGLGDLVFRRWTRPLDPALRIGLGGMLGLAICGLLLLPIGLAAQGNLRILVFAWAALAAVAGILGWAALLPSARFRLPQGAWLAAPVALGLAVLVAALTAAGPSNAFDWDTLAYHLAVPKIWLAEGKIVPISFLHHSNFPFLVDNLYLFGLAWGGAAAAKAFMVGFFALGLVAAFGLGRMQWGTAGGWWAAIGCAGIPAVLWESGTAYIDGAHGLFAGLGILLAARFVADESGRNELWLAAILLGCGAASKYTGLQIAFACGVGLFLFGAVRRQWMAGIRSALVVGIIAVGIASPWLVKNAAWVGNPVFPFFFERLGGVNWDQFAADIYRDEQQTFGVGRTDSGRDATQIGHAIWGLAYQPGRYVNPMQTEGGGFPTGALGFLPLAAAALWSLSGKMGRFEKFALFACGFNLLLWFFLSQQSRYLTTIGIPLAILVGGAAAKLPLGRLAAAGAAAQFGYSLWLVHTISLAPRLPYVLGRQTEVDFHRENGPGFYFGAQRLNEIAKDGKVALYDEVFGWFLDVPYYWANPGHSNEIPYGAMETGAELALDLRERSFTHVYLSLSRSDPNAERWLSAAGLTESPQPYTSAESESMRADLRTKWRLLLAEAVRTGGLRFVEPVPSGLIFEVQPN